MYDSSNEYAEFYTCVLALSFWASQSFLFVILNGLLGEEESLLWETGYKYSNVGVLLYMIRPMSVRDSSLRSEWHAVEFLSF